MTRRLLFAYRLIVLLVFVLAGSAVSSPSMARDAFNPFAAQRPAPMSYATPAAPFGQWDTGDRPRTHITVRPAIRHGMGEGSRTFCVRTCDGRYFPMSSAANDSAKDFCRSSCPATETKIYTGRSIEASIATDGKPYLKILHAFRFRNESVPGCTCQGGGKAGLAHIRIEDDKTIRVGDIVARTNGLMVASQGRNGMILTRIHASRLRAERLPAVAIR